MYFDKDGLPYYTIKRHFKCYFKDYVSKSKFTLPGYGIFDEAVDYSFDWLDRKDWPRR